MWDCELRVKGLGTEERERVLRASWRVNGQENMKLGRAKTLFKSGASYEGCCNEHDLQTGVQTMLLFLCVYMWGCSYWLYRRFYVQPLKSILTVSQKKKKSGVVYLMA